MAKKPKERSSNGESNSEEDKASASATNDSTSPPNKAASSWTSWFSVSNIAIVVFVAYVCMVASNLHRIMNPVAYILPPTDDDTAVDPLWSEGQGISVYCYVSNGARVNPFNEAPIWTSSDLTYSWSTDKPEISLNFVPPAHDDSDDSTSTVTPQVPGGAIEGKDGSDNTTTLTLPHSTWSRLRKGKEVFLHAFITTKGASPDPNDPSFKEPYVLHQAVPLIKKQERKQLKPKRFLLNGTSSPIPDIITDPQGLAYYWKPEVAIRIVTDFTRYPDDNIPTPLYRSFRFQQIRGRYYYLPPLFVDDIGLTMDKLVGLNSTLDSLPLRLSFSPMSLQRWQLMQVLENSLETQRGLGFEQSDIDDVRRLIADTNVLLLAVTVFASTLHLLFEFLAFHSDINFWRKNKSLRGLSVRSVVVELVFQVVILLFLIDTESSLLLTIPSAVGLMIQAWKVQRATGAQVVRDSNATLGFRLALTRLEAMDRKATGDNSGSSGSSTSSSSAAVQASSPPVVDTQALDRYAVTHLCLALFPLTIGFALRSLLLEEHSGWYSWAISSLVALVYTFGFAMMSPQLYINYRLRSVAHLPWRFLCYRFLNTFIDDLFAFIIRMPTMHRVSCFRDDIVFLIYLYQRYIYPVDESRKMDDEDCAGGGE